MKNPPGKRVPIVLAILLFATATFGQGGTGKDATPTTSPKKATLPKQRRPPHKSEKTQTSTPPVTTSNSTPVFHPQNPRIELVRISPGSFMMGSVGGGKDAELSQLYAAARFAHAIQGRSSSYANEKPLHQVTINYSFFIGKYEVTQAQWQAVMGNNPSYFKDCGICPVDQVSWNDAKRFIQRLNEMSDGYTYRLPTEAEWEYACRAGTTGDYAGDLKAMAWHSADPGDRSHAVGQKQPNAWGLYDMLGNVWEWCEDWYHETYDGAPSDGSAWMNRGERAYRTKASLRTQSQEVGPVLRGGSWLDSVDDLRFGMRTAGSPDRQNYYFGFRIVATTRAR
ncbi:MAG TPA: formylglycine-generating enzyme family protein [Pyrinomonadaceae bacterium]|nr:formylglycine-generating enzyme family protein [Pyrinomonadaceae bacterium]